MSVLTKMLESELNKTKCLRHGSLFSGIGGFDLAADWVGWQNVFHCEWNKFGQKILKYYWPKAIGYGDITKTDFTIHRGTIDILTGGFPCQPYSLAGKRKGKEDDRHLWPEMLRAIREIQPRYIVGENVLGIVNWNGGLVFNEVQVDLENEGYQVQPVILPACGVGAPHRRERVWFVAYSCDNGHKLWGFEKDQSEKGKGNIEENKRQRVWNVSRGNVQQGIIANTNSKRLQGGKEFRSITKSGEEGNEQFTRHIQSNWENFPTQSPVCSGDDGFSAELDGITFSKWRNESIKAYGNAIVPQVAYRIFRVINMHANIDFLR